MAASLRVELPKFDGSGGPVQALSFLRSVNHAMRAGNLNAQRIAGVVAGALTQGSSAETWLATLTDAQIASWDDLEPLFRARFVRAMTIPEIRRMQADLRQKPSEAVADFRDRCMVSLSAEDVMLTDDQKAEVGYATNYQRRLKRAFLSGLKSAIVDKMVGVNAETATMEELVTMATNAEVLAGCAPQSQAFGVSEVSDFDKAVEAAMVRRFGPSRGRGGPRGGATRGGGGRGAAADNGGRNLPALSDPGYASRPKQPCGRCGMKVKHRQHECVVDLENRRRRQPVAAMDPTNKDGVDNSTKYDHLNE